MRTFEAHSDTDAALWQRFTESHSECDHYHRWGWKQVIENSFGWRTFYLMAEEESGITGILPLVWQKSRLFGSFLISLPYLNGGGLVTETQEAKDALVREAIALARKLGVDHLELRHRRDHNLGLPSKTNKLAVVNEVHSDEEKMWSSLGHKVRTDIRKARKSELTAEFRGEEVLDDYYEVFAENMRNLGTPVYSRKFFLEMLRAFPSETFICIVRYHGSPVAVSFLMGYRETVEAGWSASRYRYLSIKPNMFLYWKILCFAGERGFHLFDFGRSTIDSGTHRFKMQWGGKEIPLQWDYWVRNGGEFPQLNPQNPRYRLAIGIWQRMPVGLTKLMGPRIARCLP